MQNKILILAMFLLPFATQAQKKHISTEETLKFINSKLGPKYLVDLKGGMVIVQYFDQSGKVYRIDKGDTENLAFNDISFDENEKTLIIPCTEDKCIDRRLVLRKEGGSYARISIQLEDASAAPALIKAFKHMIHSAEDVHYKSDEPFE